MTRFGTPPPNTQQNRCNMSKKGSLDATNKEIGGELFAYLPLSGLASSTRWGEGGGRGSYEVVVERGPLVLSYSYCCTPCTHNFVLIQSYARDTMGIRAVAQAFTHASMSGNRKTTGRGMGRETLNVVLRTLLLQYVPGTYLVRSQTPYLLPVPFNIFALLKASRTGDAPKKARLQSVPR